MNKRTLHKVLIGRFTWKRLVRSTAIIAVILLLFVFSCANEMIFQPPQASYGPDDGILWIPTGDGQRIAAIYYERPGAEFTILFSHGNAEDIGQNRQFYERLNRWGYSVLAYDYPGYGLSKGRPSERKTYLSIEAAYAYLLEHLGTEPGAVIALGRSVGSGPSVHLAAREPLAGLVLESGFASAFRVVTRAGVLPGDKFVNIDKMAEVRCPVLVVHGLDDEVVPFWHGEALYEAANEPKRFLWVDGAGHNDLLWVAGIRYKRAMEDFVQLIRETNP
ncbi:MAG: alpha/beta hydrolase [Phycisphaerae bacterium]|nr:alpha/beta hydrolase [Phycisphaerae bacterium]